MLRDELAQFVRTSRIGLERNIHGGGVRGGLAPRVKVDRDVKSAAALAPIYGWFTEGFDTPVLQDAKALLDELA